MTDIRDSDTNETSRTFRRTMALTKDTLIKTPLSLWVTVVVTFCTATALWAQATSQVARNTADHIDAKRERQELKEKAVKHDAYFEAIMQSLRDLREDLKDKK